MTQGSSSAATIPAQLEYAPGATVGDLKKTRANGVTTIAVGFSWRRMGQAIWPAAFVVLPALAALGLVIFISSGTRRQFDVAPTIVLALLLLVAVTGWVGSAILPTLSPLTFEAGPGGLTIRGRRWKEVYRVTFSRPQIVDVLVDRVRLPNAILASRSLLLVLSNGSQFNLGHGSAAELAFLRRSLRDAWQLPDDPLAVDRYPARPRWCSTVSRNVVPGGVVVTIAPPWVDWPGMALLPLVFAAIAVIDSVTVATGYHMPATLSLWGSARVGGMSLVCWVSALTTLRRLRWRATLSAVHGHVTLAEQSLSRPGLAEWPDERVAGVKVEPGLKGGRSTLYLVLTDGSAVPLLTNRRSTAVRYSHDALAVALHLRCPSADCPVRIPD